LFDAIMLLRIATMSPGYEHCMHVGKHYITVDNKRTTLGEMKL